jgi:hypothetical protein
VSCTTPSTRRRSRIALSGPASPDRRGGFLIQQNPVRS